LREVAALTVMYGHFGVVLGLFSVPNGFLAVDTFFIMSGFVIAHSYGERLRGGMSPWTYLYRRVVRLYPMVRHRPAAGVRRPLLRGAQRGDCVSGSGYPERRHAERVLHSIPNSLPIYSEIGQHFPANPPACSLFFEMLASGAFLLLFAQR
jgi:hypothetical protein